MGAIGAVVGGSSPRGRGKPRIALVLRRRGRLIPAWAGKTSNADDRSIPAGAHPRVGGENTLIRADDRKFEGSSPRGRGKPDLRLDLEVRLRLIPAWAGKTDDQGRRRAGVPAHPRVGGENFSSPASEPIDGGSSPRGRGKPRTGLREVAPVRLIPAWAGKTDNLRPAHLQCKAHPRVGGENTPWSPARAPCLGSSPRGRGKHFLTCAFIKRIGQILETLELAVSSGSYSLCDVYATDAPQDQARNTGLALPSSRAAS